MAKISMQSLSTLEGVSVTSLIQYHLQTMLNRTGSIMYQYSQSWTTLVVKTNSYQLNALHVHASGHLHLHRRKKLLRVKNGTHTSWTSNGHGTFITFKKS